MRLDFEEFDINGVTNEACEQDAFQVFGQDSNSIVPSICGINNAQHSYISKDFLPYVRPHQITNVLNTDLFFILSLRGCGVCKRSSNISNDNFRKWESSMAYTCKSN